MVSMGGGRAQIQYRPKAGSSARPTEDFTMVTFETRTASITNVHFGALPRGALQKRHVLKFA